MAVKFILTLKDIVTKENKHIQSFTVEWKENISMEEGKKKGMRFATNQHFWNDTLIGKGFKRVGDTDLLVEELPSK